MTNAPAERTMILGLRWDVALALLAVWVIWGTTYTAASIAVAELPPLLMTGARFITAGAISLIWLRARGAPLPDRTELRNTVLLGALLIGATGTTVISQQYIHSGFAAILGSLTPMVTALISVPFFGLPRRAEWVGIALGFAGLLLLIRDPSLQAQPLGVVIRLLSTLLWCTGSVISTRLRLPRSAPLTNALQMFFGGIVVLAMAPLKGEMIPDHVSLAAVAAWLYLVVIGAMIAYWAFVHVIRNCRPALASSYAYVNPIVALALGQVLLGESVSLIGFAAIAIVMLSVALMLRARS